MKLSTIAMSAIVFASLVASVAPAKAGQVGTGARNSYTTEHGTVHRNASGESQSNQFVRGSLTSTTLKQECTALPGSQCSYTGGVFNGGGYGYQQGGGFVDPVSITTLTTENSHFGSDSKGWQKFTEVYKGTVDTTTHEASSFGMF